MISVLMYHQISTIPQELDPSGLAVPVHIFRKQMDYMHQKKFNCLSLMEAVRYWRKNSKPQKRSFVLTFDDGYKDFYTTIAPILEHYKFTATVFLVAEQVGKKTNWQGQNGASAAQLMAWSEIKELASHGFSFGNHTLSHPRLTTLDIKDVKREIVDSKAIIEDKLGLPVDLFCYPYTANNSRIQQIVAESGHVASCGGNRGDWRLYNIWRSEYRRNDSFRSFVLKANGWHQRFVWLREQSIPGKILVPKMKSVRQKLHGNTI
ncbi:MAG: polysaccharide deacetylase family protein [Calditrichaeota bacterium]|nr:MAG: polysaccharide deacetylase family protein [Calditrichota bacterium]